MKSSDSPPKQALHTQPAIQRLRAFLTIRNHHGGNLQRNSADIHCSRYPP